MANIWTARSAAQAIQWQSVAWNGTVFCAIANTGTDRVMTSTDGVSWDTRTPASDSDWRGIAWNGSVFCAVGVAPGFNTQPVIMTSSDGISWAPQTAPFALAASRSIALNDIAWNGSVFCAVGWSFNEGVFEETKCCTSADGAAWTERSITDFGANQSDTRIAWFAGGSKFIAVPNAGGTTIATSPDGSSWTPRTCQDLGSAGLSPPDVAGNSSVAVIVGLAGHAQSSTNGETWTSRTAAASNSWTAVEWNGTQFAAVSTSGSGNRVMVSSNGTSWTAESSAENNSWRSIVANSSGKWVAVASDGTNRVMTGENISALPFITNWLAQVP